MASTNMITGLASGLDWQSMVDQLIAADHTRVDLISAKQESTQTRLTEWQSFNTKLLAMKTAAANLKDADAFNLFKAELTSDSATVEGGSLLSVTASAAASVGSYTLTVNALAGAQKVSSGSFASASTALGAGLAGDLLINGTVITVEATDTLTSLKEKINNANSGTAPTGVTAGLVSYGAGDVRLILTSNSTGASGIGLLNGGGTDILGALGFGDTSRAAKNHLAGGDRTDRFTSTSISIQSLLGLTNAQAAGAGEIVINGQAVGAIDLETDTLDTLLAKLTAAGLAASITTETAGNTTAYRLMIAGAVNTYTDKGHILETLGLIEAGVSDVKGVTGDVANTSAGAVITAETLLKDIDGYTGYSDTDYIHLEGTDSDGYGVSDDTFLLSDTATVGDLLTKVEALFGDVTATITGDGKLRFVDDTPGSSPLAVKIGVKNSGGADDATLTFDGNGDLGSAVTVRKREMAAGSDASVTVDGVTVTRTDNTISDIVEGVTLDLLKADTDTTVTVEIGRDQDAILSKISALVTSYNAISATIRTQTSYDATLQKAGGALFGDGTLASVKTDLTSILIQNVWGVSADYATLGLVGISVDRVGQLSVDDDVLRGALATNFNDVRKLFAANGLVSTSSLEYVSHGLNTKTGEYVVHIDTAATKSTSPPSDSTTLSGDEVLTITDGTKVAAVDLTNGMSMSQIVNAVNSELMAVHTQVLAGAEPLYADSGQLATITAATKWNSIYNASGGTANLDDDSTVSFTGVTNGGTTVSGSYTIADVAAESVQGLLSAIETAFGNQVTAAIDASGRIVVTDKTSGSSRLALSLDMSLAHDLDFGSVTSDNAGGQAGRYAMEITASADGGSHLVLAHNAYGSQTSFTIHQENDRLWTSGDQTVDNGKDVAGTINGERATGAGQVLTGDGDEANVDSLAIRYTGAAEGTDAGTIKLTLGVAELYDRALFHITDSLEGYVSFKQQSLQDSIKAYTSQIDEMEIRLASKHELMINQFVKMELALQKIQNQSNWLTGQLDAASQGWWRG